VKKLATDWRFRHKKKKEPNHERKAQGLQATGLKREGEVFDNRPTRKSSLRPKTLGSLSFVAEDDQWG